MENYCLLCSLISDLKDFIAMGHLNSKEPNGNRYFEAFQLSSDTKNRGVNN